MASAAAAATTSGSSSPKDAVSQIEFYFADSNLPFDKFMWGLHTANDEHWVPINTVASFKRMKTAFPDATVEWVADAIRTHSTDLQVSEDGKSLRRTTEVKEPKDAFEKSIYAKGFGAEESDTQQKIESFFTQYGKTAAVRLRRDEKKDFKGSVFVEFAEFPSVEAFLKADPPPSWNGEPLVLMTKDDYCTKKITEKGLTGKSAIYKREAIGRTGFNAFREDKKSKSDAKSAKKRDIWLEFMGSKIKVLDEDGGKVNPEDVPYVKGATLKFSGCGGSVNFPEVKKPLTERFSRPPFIKFEQGEDHGMLAFDKTLSDEDIEFVKKQIPLINNLPITWSLCPEDEEKQFQIERAQFAAKQALGRLDDSSKRGGGKGGRGGRGGGRGRGGGSRSGRTASAKDEASAETGDKRKRAIEPDGGPDKGVRGKDATVPSVGSGAAKKAKVDE